MNEIHFLNYPIDWKWLIPLLVSSGILLMNYLNLKKKISLVKDLSGDEHLKLTNFSGAEIDYYWGERKKGDADIIEKLIGANTEIFISGIALRTLSNILRSQDVLEHVTNKINEPNSEFRIKIIACDSAQNAKRIEIPDTELESRITEGKQNLSYFKDEVYKEIKKWRTDEEASRPFLEFFNYAANVIPRHFIVKIDDYIYTGSYLHSQEGKKSYMMRLKKLTSAESNDYLGLYNLFINEVDFLKSECTSQYNF